MMATSSSESESDIEPTCGLDGLDMKIVEKREDHFIRTKFRYFWIPLAIGIAFELALVTAVWYWQSKNRDVVRKVVFARGEEPDGLFLPANLFPVVFIACLLGRAATMYSWKWGLFGGKDSRFSAIFMGFNCLQWVAYIALYFWLMDNITIRKATWKPSTELMLLPHDLLPLADRVACVDEPDWIDAHGNTCQDYARKNLTKSDCGTGAIHCQWTCKMPCPTPIDRFRRCTANYSESFYNCSTVHFRNGMWEKCTKPYDPKTCSGYVFVNGPTPYNTSSVKCCIEMEVQLVRPQTDDLWTSSIQAFSLQIEDVFEMSKWIAILVMTWSLQESPFLPPTPMSKDFMNGVWLDILDCFMFVANINDKQIQMPSFGLTVGGMPSPLGVRPQFERWIWYTWLLASTCAVLSPMIFTWFRPDPRKTSKSAQLAEATKESLLDELINRVNVLDRVGAEKLLEQAFKKSQEAVAEMDKKPHFVRVLVLDDPEASVFVQTGRKGKAWREKNQATYTVQYDDDGETEVGVPLEKLQPTHDQPRMDWTCSGWGDTGFLCQKDVNTQRLHMATFLDAWRSLFTLELPFFFFRLWLHWGDTSGIQVHLLTVKNGLFGLSDLLTILACGSQDASIMGFSPAALISRFLAGHVTGAVQKAGPGALMSKATKYALQAASMDLQELELKKAFLVQERHLALAHQEDEVAKRFQEEIDKVSKELDDEQTQQALLKQLG